MLFKTTRYNDAPTPGILTPALLSSLIQAGFDRDFGPIKVEGEISELSLPYSGHAYFCLKEKVNGQEARLKAVMWKSRRPYAGAALSDGLTVLARGRLAVYPPRGEYQLVVDHLEPRGEGALRQAFEQLQKKLTAEGLFEEGRKRPLPFWPEKVAIISSPSGAALRDFLSTAQALRPKAAISLYPVRVQGAEAAREIAEAVADLNAQGTFDLIVLTRGGGSLSDLWAFNEEITVRAVAASRTTTLAAIGHSTDLTLTELAADQRAITPTAAAEAIFRDQRALEEHLGQSAHRLGRAMDELICRQSERLTSLAHRFQRGLELKQERRHEELEQLTRRLGRFEDRLGFCGVKIDELEHRLGRGVRNLLAHHQRRFDGLAETLRILGPGPILGAWQKELTGLTKSLANNMAQHLAGESQRLENLSARLVALSPESIMRRGYALVTGPNSTPLTRTDGLKPDQEVLVRLAVGQFTAQVKDIS